MVSDDSKENEEKLEVMRHSASHVMAQAVQSIFPEVKFGIGPAIAYGFYYDFELPRSLVPEDLTVIEARMREIIAENKPFLREVVTKEDARRLFAGQPYKLELLEEIPEPTVTVYRQGSFIDLCRGPHVRSTGEIGPFKLMNTAGAYWRGDEHCPMLQRIYGVAFDTREALDDYTRKYEEAIRRDHRKLGTELDLYSIHEEAGPGLVHWHPKGSAVRRAIEDFWKDEHCKRSYDIVYTPHIARLTLWKTSGHWEFYRESLYSPMDVDGQEYLLKPMNCLGHILIYKCKMHSYRELPIRYAELGTVYRYERSGTLHGLARVRGFTQDDAHIFCRFDQLEDEVAAVLNLARFMMQNFGFDDYEVFLSTRPEKAAGSPEIWEMATETLRKALVRVSIPYTIDPGEGVFYGPKIDIKFKDAQDRLWQGPTIQVDFNNPERFDVTYTGEDGREHPVAMVHRTVLGSMERFMAALTEHYGGAFPTWLAPVQVAILPIADRHLEYANKLADDLRNNCFRVNVDSRSERVNLKIRQAQLDKVPFTLVVGDKEAAAGTVAIRLRGNDQVVTRPFIEFKDALQATIRNRDKEVSWEKFTAAV